ncbi:MAG: hypothetical protein ACXVDA_26250, partial [Ktedonobacterales bacterium]
MTHDIRRSAEGEGLVLRAGRILDPSQQIDGPGEVLIVDGRVQAIGSRESVEAKLAELGIPQ